MTVPYNHHLQSQNVYSTGHKTNKLESFSLCMLKSVANPDGRHLKGVPLVLALNLIVNI
jgi:hypothetical protein